MRFFTTGLVATALMATIVLAASSDATGHNNARELISEDAPELHRRLVDVIDAVYARGVHDGAHVYRRDQARYEPRDLKQLLGRDGSDRTPAFAPGLPPVPVQAPGLPPSHHAPPPPQGVKKTHVWPPPQSGHGVRRFAVAANEDVRSKLTEGLKAAMKAKDTSKSTIIRSMLSEVYDGDKKKQEKLATPAIQALIQKAVQRRKDAAKQYESGSRSDLASQELSEVAVLSEYLPPSLASEEVDRLLREAIAQSDIQPGARDSLGKVFKVFYAKVDRAAVDGAYVKQRAEELLKGQ
ncbi:hypothetical protein EIP91_003692 [Steccherinum ochraceum]|uniref:Altered inheritance of mitochondria protein 41 n=1 Tax=Steccherinum ochraceum TaxID=92696 RepID=A0A4R0RCK7_9APHY|nr:hypothetical protein EIP91_003692 [Steccherinum ochraceum]